MGIVIDNTAARRLFLHRHALTALPPAGNVKAAVSELIDQLGFVQIDSINTISRAHHMILHARRPGYRPRHLKMLLENDRSLFEHWTHDAAVIPTQFFPYWNLRFQRNKSAMLKRWSQGGRKGFENQIGPVMQQIQDHGPVCSSDVGGDEPKRPGGWWEWHPSKAALEFLWHTGELVVTRRQGFRKFYDLPERVLPQDVLEARPDLQETINWACTNALDRLGFATAGEIASFWDKVTNQEARAWCENALNNGYLIEVGICGHDGQVRRSFARPTIIEDTRNVPAVPGGIRILSPFDPALRDRARAQRLFGFHYRIEIYVPAAKRQYGYYVFPVLEGDRLIGRVDMKADRKSDTLQVTAFWPEQSVAMGKGRLARLETAIERTRRLADVGETVYRPGWLRR